MSRFMDCKKKCQLYLRFIVNTQRNMNKKSMITTIEVNLSLAERVHLQSTKNTVRMTINL